MLWFLLTLTLILIWTLAAFLSLPGAALSERIERIKQRLINWYKKPTDPVRLAAYGALGLSVVIGVVGYFELLPLPQKLIDDFYANGAAELASIAITVLIIDRLVEWRASRRRKDEILEQLGSLSNEFAREAARIAYRNGWLRDGISLRGANLRDANLREILLAGPNFCGANLQRAIFTNADLRAANFVHCNLQYADFSGSLLPMNKFGGANLHSTRFCTVILHDSNFQGAYLEKTDFADANLSFADFTNTRLLEVDFTRSHLTHVKLTGADLGTATLAEAVLTNATYDKYTQWPEGFDPAAHGANLVEGDE